MQNIHHELRKINEELPISLNQEEYTSVTEEATRYKQQVKLEVTNRKNKKLNQLNAKMKLTETTVTMKLKSFRVHVKSRLQALITETDAQDDNLNDNGIPIPIYA